jgi:hypothetical protein
MGDASSPDLGDRAAVGRRHPSWRLTLIEDHTSVKD